MSAAGVDLQNPWEVRKYLQDHARPQTREAVEKSDVMLALATHTGERSKALIEGSRFYMDAIATQYGVRKERIQEIVAAGVDLRDRRAVRAALATQGTQPASALPSPTNVAPNDPELERAKAKIEAMAANAPPAAPARPPALPTPPRPTLTEDQAEAMRLIGGASKDQVKAINQELKRFLKANPPKNP